MFTIHLTNPSHIKTIGDKTISVNRWVYDLVTEIISPKRVAISNRRGYPSAVTHALPTLPNVYYILEPHVYPPKFKKMKACNYHRYTDDHPDISTDDEDEYIVMMGFMPINELNLSSHDALIRAKPLVREH